MTLESIFPPSLALGGVVCHVLSITFSKMQKIVIGVQDGSEIASPRNGTTLSSQIDLPKNDHPHCHFLPPWSYLCCFYNHTHLFLPGQFLPWEIWGFRLPWESLVVDEPAALDCQGVERQAPSLTVDPQDYSSHTAKEEWPQFGAFQLAPYWLAKGRGAVGTLDRFRPSLSAQHTV